MLCVIKTDTLHDVNPAKIQDRSWNMYRKLWTRKSVPFAPLVEDGAEILLKVTVIPIASKQILRLVTKA